MRNVSLGRAWLLLCFALAVHVADEALTGFLDVYNPTVTSIMQSVPWLVLPVFRFDVWLAGLVFAVVLLSLLAIYAFQDARWIRPAGYVFAIIMTLNAFGHSLGTLRGRTVNTVQFDGPMPGFYSSPLLLAASVYLLYQLRNATTGAGTSLQHP